MRLIHRLGAPCKDNHQFFCVPRSLRQNFDAVNETIHFSAFTVLNIRLLMSMLLSRAHLKNTSNTFRISSERQI